MSAALASSVASCSLPLFLPSPLPPRCPVSFRLYISPCWPVSPSLPSSLLLIPHPSFLSLPHPRTWHRGILNWHPCASNTDTLSLSPSLPLFRSIFRSPRTFFSEFESIKNRLEQRNERPPISHRIMSGAPSWPRRNANHGQAS